MMKKMLSKLAVTLVILCLALAGTFAGVFQAAEPESAQQGPNGIFKLVEMIVEGETLSEDDIKTVEAYGQTFYLDFSEDGTVYMNSFGEESNGTWDESSITIGGETMSYELDGDTLTLEEEGLVATLKRSSQEEIDSILAAGTSTDDSGVEASSTDAGTGTSTDGSGAETSSGDAGAGTSTGSSESGTSTGNMPEPVNKSATYQLGGDYVTGEEVLVDTDDCAMTVTGYSTEDTYYGFTVDVRCENRTTDTTMMFSVSDAVINGYMMLPLFSAEVTPGNNAAGKIYFTLDDLERAGIPSVDELQMELTVYNSDDWSADYIYKGTVTIYPTGKSAADVVSPEHTASENDSVAVDDDNISFIIVGTEHDDMWESTDVLVYMENRTDANLNFSWNNVAVNGTMIDPYWAKEVLAGARAYAAISFYDSSLEEKGITDITSIEYELRVSDADDWLADPLVDETFTWNP